jgi:DNA-binding LacI/PurR family transcriptional regulator
VVDNGAVAARMLVDRLDDPGRPRQQHLAPTELVARTTTGRVPQG